jgi:triacylglycerol lipase
VLLIVIATIQSSIVGLALAALLSATVWCILYGHPTLWLAIVTAVVLGHGMVLAVEFALMCVVNRRGDVPRPTFGKVLRAWFTETQLAIKVFAWRQPFQANAVPDFVPSIRGGPRGTILIHGYACNRGIWNKWLARLRKQAVPTIAVNLEPPWAPIGSYQRQIEQAVTEMVAATGLPPILVGHSMGGLAARHWYAAQKDPARIHHLVTMGSPHRGTWLARFALGANGGQMRPGSMFLKTAAEADTALHLQRMTCFYSHCDNIVFPAINATLAGADNRHVEGCAHMQLIEHADCWATLQDLLAPTAAYGR